MHFGGMMPFSMNKIKYQIWAVPIDQIAFLSSGLSDLPFP
jgi:hypothetical protein